MSRNPTSPHTPSLVRFDAAAAVDACGTQLQPASLLVQFADRPDSMFPARLLALGTPAAVNSHEAARSPALRTVSRPRAILIPGLVNTHAHLDLTHIGPQPHDPDRGFMPWIDMIRTRRETAPEQIAASVRRGVTLSLAAGTVAVGDIAGAVRAHISFDPVLELRRSLLIGVSWLEFFGIGRGQAGSLEMLDRLRPAIQALATGNHRVRLGLQPHAPNTVSRVVYAKALDLAATLGHAGAITTHLAETAEERQFIGAATGPQRELLEALGLWDESVAADLGRGLHPVEYLRPVLSRTPFTVAHVNDATDKAIATLAATGTRVAYCPRASAYFGSERAFGHHRYREMLQAGICVALGTDSVVNLPPAAGQTSLETPGGRGISILDEMQFLRARDRMPGVDLLRMGTTNGAVALGLDPDAFGFAAGGPLAGLVAVEPPQAERTAAPSDAVVAPGATPELLFASIFSDLPAARPQ